MAGYSANKIIDFTNSISRDIKGYFKKNWLNCIKSLFLFGLITYSSGLLGMNVWYYKYGTEEHRYFPKMNFGIDIVGGHQLTVAIDSSGIIDDFVKQNLSLADNVCKENHIVCDVRKDGNDIVIGYKTRQFKKDIIEFRKVFNQEGLPVEVLTKNKNKESYDILMKIDILQKVQEKIISDTTDKAISILKNRIDGVGVKEINIQRYGADKIVILVPEGVDINRIYYECLLGSANDEYGCKPYLLLGQAILSGIGCKPNKTRALRWFKKARDDGQKLPDEVKKIMEE